jgi:site-specific DNA-methyltransferase (adenine-specific)
MTRVTKKTAQVEATEIINPVDGVVLDAGALAPLNAVYRDDSHGIFLYEGDTLEVLDKIAERYPDGCFDMIFADPPYFLSNGGITCHAGKMVKVNKGDWDKSRGAEENHNFNGSCAVNGYSNPTAQSG